jgi:hypothetical protein
MHAPRPDHGPAAGLAPPPAGTLIDDELHDSCPDCAGTPATGTCTCPPLWSVPDWVWV